MTLTLSWSKLDTINLAFSLLNKASVSDLTDSGVFSDSASRIFDLLFQEGIQSKAWRFAVTTQQLDVLPTPPPIQWWTYQLQLPSDYLAMVRTYPPINFQIYEDNIIYTNNNNVMIEYRRMPDITKCPAYFIKWFAAEIAAWYAHSVADDDKLAEKLKADALSCLGEALFVDSQSHPTPAMYNNPLIQARGQLWYDYDLSPMVGP